MLNLADIFIYGLNDNSFSYSSLHNRVFKILHLNVGFVLE
ncbi:hypothetical protein LEP1GSC036_1579 [Leptospira weilii str. 2006001853]|uniref:Uncharacterized protein n=2 Tax=Leptospira weilii TaxID=28184 RepID=A0A828YWT0_9LEPT|nr:hypothetical protein LEP1GSC036_1579 [Leptospira weilii str. 2006001853]EMM73968.1 hypothetical protein LEP1GSC038_2264 [Leptospira weilii str. 2006001855]EMN42625.1 hypothetical protein LEP1GSC086_1485 [Leptospira weilii str. LNT 1234]